MLSVLTNQNFSNNGELQVLFSIILVCVKTWNELEIAKLLFLSNLMWEYLVFIPFFVIPHLLGQKKNLGSNN